MAVPSGATTVLAGLVGGLIYVLRKGNFLPTWGVMLYAACVEIFLTGFVLLIARPFNSAVEAVKVAAVLMILANAAGTGIFAFIIHNLITERKNAAEKERYRAELERKKFELEAARSIQSSFLPESVPQIRGFDIAAFTLPALEVGGDFYDFIPISRDRWGFVIADVSGKGFPAALFMALSRTLVRAYAVGNPTVSEAINKKNEQFGTEGLAIVVDSNRNLSTQEIVKRVEQDVTEFSQGQPQFDDITLLILKVG